VGKFRGWHILAGIAAMVITGILGNLMGLNNTASFMASCVVFVAVALWTESRLTRRRRETARQAPRDSVHDRPEPDER
jgi:hypothetical protein